MDIIRKLFKQTIWQIIGKIGTSLSTLFILRMVTHTYMAYGTGVFTLALTYLSYFVIVIDFGLNATVLQEFTGDKTLVSWQKLFGLRLILASMLLFLSIILVVFWSNGDPIFKQLIFIGAFMAMFESAIFVTCSAIFQFKLRFDKSTFASLIGVGVTVLASYYVISNSLPLPYLMIAYSLGWLVMAILALWFVKKYLQNLAPIIDFWYITQILKKVWPISLTLILNVIYFRFDAFVLTFIKGFSEVGIYNVAYQIFQAALVFPAYIMNGFYPLMLDTFQNNKPRFIHILLRSCLIMLVLGILGTLVTLFLAPFVISLLASGNSFNGSIVSLRILSLGFPAFFVSAVLMWTLVTLKKYKAMIAIYLLGLIFNVILNMLFIPAYSYIASSYITVFSEYLILVLQVFILWEEFRK